MVSDDTGRSAGSADRLPATTSSRGVALIDSSGLYRLVGSMRSIETMEFGD
jgi:hypothetical protein